MYRWTIEIPYECEKEAQELIDLINLDEGVSVVRMPSTSNALGIVDFITIIASSVTVIDIGVKYLTPIFKNKGISKIKVNGKEADI